MHAQRRIACRSSGRQREKERERRESALFMGRSLIFTRRAGINDRSIPISDLAYNRRYGLGIICTRVYMCTRDTVQSIRYCVDWPMGFFPLFPAQLCTHLSSLHNSISTCRYIVYRTIITKVLK